MAPKHDLYSKHEKLSDELIVEKIRKNVRPIQLLIVAQDRAGARQRGIQELRTA